jgi:hypothetical protein
MRDPGRPCQVSTMSTRPRDTSAEAWRVRNEAIAALDGGDRLRIAIDLSDSVREIQLAGILSRNPGWSRADAVRQLVLKQTGIDLGEGA